MKQEPMKTLTVSLSPHQVSRLHVAVESGQYASNSEVVRDALRLWEQREELRELEISRLKRAYTEGMASGDAGELDRQTFLAEINADHKRRG
jgi:antitoxin ParD1/3/4